MPTEKSKMAAVNRIQFPRKRMNARQPNYQNEEREKHEQIADRADDRRFVTTQQRRAMHAPVTDHLESRQQQQSRDVTRRDFSLLRSVVRSPLSVVVVIALSGLLILHLSRYGPML